MAGISRQSRKPARRSEYPVARHSVAWRSFPVVFAAAFALVLLVLGGASRIDSMAQIPVGLMSAAMIGVGIASLPRGALVPYRLPLAFLAACIVAVAAQLVPLPPAMWAGLPGHAIYREGAEAAGIAQPWRPVSISPDLTWAALVGVFTPVAAVFAMAVVTRERSRVLLPALLCAAIAAIVLGLAQLGGGAGSPLRYYAVTNPDAPVGFFANRNHFAFFLAMMVPLLAVWARAGGEGRRTRVSKSASTLELRPTLALAGLSLLVPMILLSGSRAGMVLAGALLVPSVLLFLDGRQVRFDRRTAAYALGGLGLVGAAVVATILAARATAIARLVEEDPAADLRAKYVQPSIEAIWTFFPFGSGFGTFDPVFRRFEPYESLGPKYGNHAHNELLELAIEGGMFAIALMVLLASWWAYASWRIWVGRAGARGDDLAKVGSLMSATLMVASVGDYPLRTPFLAGLFTVAIVWMLGDRSVNPRFTGD